MQGNARWSHSAHGRRGKGEVQMHSGHGSGLGGEAMFMYKFGLCLAFMLLKMAQ